MLAHLVWVVEVASSHPVKFFQFFTSLEQFRQIIRNRISGVFLLMHLHPIYLHTAKNQYRKFETKRNCLASVSIFYIHVSVSDFYIPRIRLPILLQENM
jgi:hypothetical protein